MALDFPANPVDGQAYGSYVYNASVGAWQSKEDPATVATVSAVAPASGNPGDIWYDSDDGTTYIYYDDGNSGQWVELLSSGVPLLNTKADLSGATFTGNVTAPRFISNIATGTSPFQVTSTTAVTNLNADLLDGNHSTAFAPAEGSSNITALGTVTSGTWSASTIGINKGGTGGTTVTEAQTNLQIPLSHNYLINGAFEINQRGFVSNTTGAYGFDRWAGSATTGTYSAQTFAPGAGPTSEATGGNFARIVTSTHSAAGDYANYAQAIEDVRTLAGKTITVSFYAKAASGTPKIGIELNQWFGTGTGETNTPFGFVTLSTTWQRYSITGTVPSVSGKTIANANNFLKLIMWVSSGSTYATRASSIGIQNNTFDIWGVQVEQGSVATPFRRNANSIQGELAACQRYFEAGSLTEWGIYWYGGTSGYNQFSLRKIIFSVPKRSTPTVSVVVTNIDNAAAGNGSISGVTVNGFSHAQSSSNNSFPYNSISLAYSASAEL